MAEIFNIPIDEFIGKVFVDSEDTEENSEKIDIEKLKKHLYILGAIIGFLAFQKPYTGRFLADRLPALAIALLLSR